MFLAGNEPDNYWSATFGDGYYVMGNHPTLGNQDGAVRFPGVTGTGNCAEARLYLHCDDRSGSTGSIYFNVWGIDEDNTSLFTGSPLGRAKTTATFRWDEGSMPVEGTFLPYKNVTSIVNEIRSRGGWSSGNAIGFIFTNDGSTTSGSWFSGGTQDVPPSTITNLMIRESANPNFNPTSKSVSAPTFPAADDFGIKISYPGYSVFDATEDQLYRTTRKKVHKIISEGSINTTGGVTYNIAHGLSVIPFVQAYAKSTSNNTRFKLPRYFPVGTQLDPSGDNLQGTVEVDLTNVKITTSLSATVYYRIFIDELET